MTPPLSYADGLPAANIFMVPLAAPRHTTRHWRLICPRLDLRGRALTVSHRRSADFDSADIGLMTATLAEYRQDTWDVFMARHANSPGLPLGASGSDVIDISEVDLTFKNLPAGTDPIGLSPIQDGGNLVTFWTFKISEFAGSANFQTYAGGPLHITAET